MEQRTQDVLNNFTRTPPPPQSESRRRQSVDRALHDAEAKLQELNRRDETTAAPGDDLRRLATTASAAAAEENGAVVVELRGQVSRATERAEILEERLDETARVNRRLEREVAEAVELGVSRRCRFRRRRSGPCCCVYVV